MDGIILINKEKGYTSRDLVNIACKVFKTKKIGHTGVLDKEAEGLVVLCLNRACKIIQFLENDNKKYEAILELGKSTTTYDKLGEITNIKKVEKIEDNIIENVCKSFIGVNEQYPPIYSNIKVDGKRLYQYALENKEVKIKSRTITIHDLTITKIDLPNIYFNVFCSKGTYIRSLCVDIASKLDYPGYMKDLKRTEVGNFNLSDANTIEELKQGEVTVFPMDQGLNLPQIIVENEKDVKNGKIINNTFLGKALIYNKNNELLAIYEGDGKQMKCIRGLWS